MGSINKVQYLLAGAVIAIACSQASAADVTIGFLSSQKPGAFSDVIASFEKANPGIKVQAQYIPFDQLNAQVQARLGSGDTSVDVYTVDEPRVPYYAHRGFLMDLSDQRAEIEAASNAAPIAGASYDGKIWAFPFWTTAQFLFYNKDLLNKAGLPEPTGDPAKRLTWEELLPNAKKAQEAGAKWGFAFDQNDRYYELQPLYESLGYGPGLKGDKLLEPALTSDGWVKTTNWYRDLYANGLAPRGVTYEQMPALFSSGQLAYMVGGVWHARAFRNAEGLNFGVAAMPYFKDGKPVTPTGSWTIGVNPKSTKKDAALAFAKYITLNSEGALQASTVAPQPPANKSAFEAYLKRESEAGKTPAFGDIVRYDLANTAVNRPRTIGYVVFEENMNKTFSDIRNGAEAKPSLERAEGVLRAGFGRLN
ncbi:MULTISPECIES: sugar ABC transporter substrate-binding protein [unclassified Chelatococcus]|jgi:ABC-type glycerol-3-phosphate transport system substrate-binding protein|uniref:sugar ABC transporter substrate-binding protein n=1 Tax=unclassified Chelatococcus TaxID=2638111 RepID=UPI001BCB5440|nr:MULTISPECIES: sugar ABC transporter substrate-binding protein [unclassified Chelatococcus]CAH1651236.1 Maltose/maltodextrin ABC transporter, substrate binding periplasmic protein MalE [Hyphomicrobiales bacterium]MBS7743200.1 sugar ABC transporter substrate-binding protein [Chelatococcus sp. HY11]MBX3541682.1 sugar ABC transporter substrate-binding protein [Chelatococcus sp.]MCO5074426.1 sugar ABC transporter substrate-binding protein [Chelatococcus sp.]CAH1693111.1 Maltose/maltodextrin ABC 